MVKSASPWLRTLMRAGKTQQRSAARVLSAMLAPAKPAAKPRVKAAAKAVAKPKLAMAPAVRTALAPAKPATARPTTVRPEAAKPATARPKVAKPKAAPARLALAPEAPAPGKFLAAQFALEGAAARRISYWLYLPDTPPPPAGYPLIVMLHGCEQSATLFAQGTRMNQVAGRAGYAVLYPQQSVSVHPRRCWKWYERATQQGGGEVPLLAALVSHVVARYGMNRTRVYLGGLSAGAAMANILALHHPELFAALGMHSGPLYGAGHSTVGALTVMRHGALHRVDAAISEVRAKWAAFPPMPTMLIQGADDDIVRPINQDQLVRQAMLLNDLPASVPVVVHKPGGRRALPYQLHDVYQGRKLMLRVARIAELKHAWSGGDPTLSYNSGAGPDASKMLVSFFGKHRRVLR